MKIVLIGFACCYKTSAGKLLADKLNYDHVDVDAIVEDVANKSIAEIFATKGESEFRKLENDALLAVRACGNTVISCGGGSALCRDFKLLADVSTVVWLTAKAETVMSRLGGAVRPLFDGKSVDDVSRIMDGRNAYYSKYADITVATDGLTSEQVADVLFRMFD